MATADCIVTKAGPGTIAEACCCGLPIMLSGYLPGQETGNVNFVVDNQFGAYNSEPKEIANTVVGWMSDPQLLKEMSERSLASSRPGATERIADDIVELIDAPALAPNAGASGSRPIAAHRAAATNAKSLFYNNGHPHHNGLRNGAQAPQQVAAFA